MKECNIVISKRNKIIINTKMKTTTTLRKALIFGSSLLVASTMFLTSCGNDDEDVTPAPTEDTVITGEITGNRTLDASKTYTLSGGVHIKAGATLTIPAGTMIKSNPDEAVAYLLVEQGAKVDAQGTAASPIVFTSGNETPKRGDWGGIIVCGKAPINAGSTATAEVGDVLYGGSDAADNSGIYKYIRVEYTGNAINDDKEHNGFTFNGVGSATTVEYLQAYMGNDDGFEFFGGTLKANYLVSTGSKDDSFDWTYGWAGSGSYWYAEQANDAGDRGIEADNNSKDHTASPYSNPTLSNITLKGNKTDGNDGIRLRVGTKGNLSNVMVDNFGGAGVQVKDDQTGLNVNDGSLTVSNVKLSNVTTEFGYPDNVTADKKFTNGTTATGSGSTWMSGWTKELDSDKKVK